ncbi:hypothetical protein HIM_00321 [Hirsutella minnesotensis 3608]|nr:hypothetical protein HIM_00321 [Hirsutella minnesotensis 3608]
MTAGRRRAATAVRRRKPTYAEIFTAFYSSVFATAAVVDAVRKDDRRKKLDQQLEEARRELSDLQQKGTAVASESDFKTSSLTDKQMDAVWQCIKTIYDTRPFMKEIHKPVTVSPSELVNSLRHDYYACPSEDTIRVESLTDYDKLEQAIRAEESDNDLAYRAARSEIQLRHETINVQHLVNKLLHRTLGIHKLSKGRDSSHSPSFEKVFAMTKAKQPDFTYRQVDPEQARRNTRDLNRQLRSIIDAPNLGLKEKIGRVCYNLFVSAHAADTHTYNTLILAFDKKGLHTYADAVAHSFLRKRLLMPTPTTFATVLNHYKLAHNHGKFLSTLSCMVGSDGKIGAKVRRRHIADIANTGLWAWAENTHKRSLNGDFVCEHAPLTRAVVQEAIAGLLHFRLFEQAASLLVTCVQSGIVLSSKVARRVLDECIVALDWNAAVHLVRGLTKSTQKWKQTILTGHGEADSYLISCIYALLDLCGLRLCGSGRVSEACLANLDISRPKLDQFVADLARRKSNLDQPCLPALATRSSGDGGDGIRSGGRLLQIESIWKEYVRVRNTTSSIESKLLYPDFSSGFRAALALHIGDAAVQRSVQLRREFEQVMDSRKQTARTRVSSDEFVPKAAVTRATKGTRTPPAARIKKVERPAVVLEIPEPRVYADEHRYATGF